MKAKHRRAKNISKREEGANEGDGGWEGRGDKEPGQSRGYLYLLDGAAPSLMDRWKGETSAGRSCMVVHCLFANRAIFLIRYHISPTNEPFRDSVGLMSASCAQTICRHRVKGAQGFVPLVENKDEGR